MWPWCHQFWSERCSQVYNNYVPYEGLPFCAGTSYSGHSLPSLSSPPPVTLSFTPCGGNDKVMASLGGKGGRKSRGAIFGPSWTLVASWQMDLADCSGLRPLTHLRRLSNWAGLFSHQAVPLRVLFDCCSLKCLILWQHFQKVAIFQGQNEMSQFIKQ